MGIFGQLFGGASQGGKQQQKRLSWISLSNPEQLAAIEEASENKLQFIYKHSTTCGISGMVLRRLERTLDIPDKAADFYFLDLHSHREVSNAVSQQFGIPHESPQLLIVKNGTVVASASHGSIMELDFKTWE